MTAAKLSESDVHLRKPEDAFLNGFAMPLIFDYIRDKCGMSADHVRHGLMSESFRWIPEFASYSPKRPISHPLCKKIQSKSDIAKKWLGELSPDINPLTQACPDFAFNDPIPHRIIGEGKYFDGHGENAAKNALAEAFYETFFYGAQPSTQGRGNQPDWNFDYACLLAYDASEKGEMFKFWNSLNAEVKKGFWKGANVYMMIIRGERTDI